MIKNEKLKIENEPDPSRDLVTAGSGQQEAHSCQLSAIGFQRTTNHGSRATSHASRDTRYELRALTLTELLVVAGIIVILLAISIPAISVWESRRIQDAINLASGMLQVTQTTAISESRTMGLFFYVDPNDNTQYIWPIEAATDIFNSSQTLLTAEGFGLRDVEPFKLPFPMRAVPLSVINPSLPTRLLWDEVQLANYQLAVDATKPEPDYNPNDANGWGTDGTQFHRNHFVMLFDRDGRIISDQQVYIYDPDLPTATVSGEHPGFRSHLTVSDGSAIPPYSVIYKSGGPSIRFLSAAGFLIYDDQAFGALPKPGDSGYVVDSLRKFFEQTAQPMMIHAVTGRLIKGQAGTD